jgi:hypothetical protein
MSTIRLTTRGKVILAVLVIAGVLALMAAVTPDECNVSSEDMSQACKSLLYS